jgi:hypothetical protein
MRTRLHQHKGSYRHRQHSRNIININISNSNNKRHSSGLHTVGIAADALWKMEAAWLEEGAQTNRKPVHLDGMGLDLGLGLDRLIWSRELRGRVRAVVVVVRVAAVRQMGMRFAAVAKGCPRTVVLEEVVVDQAGPGPVEGDHTHTLRTLVRTDTDGDSASKARQAWVWDVPLLLVDNSYN